jgi:hypothetical protein
VRAPRQSRLLAGALDPKNRRLLEENSMLNAALLTLMSRDTQYTEKPTLLRCTIPPARQIGKGRS